MVDEGGVVGFLRALRRPKVERTCQACRFRWKVPRYFASPQTQGDLEAKARSPLAGQRGRQAAARRAKEFAEMRAAYDRCPRCARVSFTQHRLWAQSKETYLGIERY
jgi:hypothetical protein